MFFWVVCLSSPLALGWVANDAPSIVRRGDLKVDARNNQPGTADGDLDVVDMLKVFQSLHRHSRTAARTSAAADEMAIAIPADGQVQTLREVDESRESLIRALLRNCSGFAEGGGASTQTPPEVVIGIVTNKKNHPAAQVQNSWLQSQIANLAGSVDGPGASAIRIVYFTNSPLQGAEAWYDGDQLSSYASAQDRYIKAIRFMSMDCAGYLASLKWFMLIDDDTLVHPRQLLRLIGALEQRFNPKTDAYVLGRHAMWSKTPTIFGGNGMLFSQHTLSTLARAAESNFPNAQVVDAKKAWYEPRIQAVLDAQGAGTIHTVYSQHCFGVNINNQQDEVSYMQLHPAWRSQAADLKATVTLHKVKREPDYRFAEQIFAECDASVEDFKRLLSV